MKKQVLLLLFAFAVMIAGMNQASAQTYKNPSTSVWAAPTCGGSEYYPTIGTPYHYIVDIEAINGYDGSGTFSWKVTKATDLIDGAAETPGTDFTWSGNNTKDVAITWNPTSLNGTYYLVVEYSQELTAPAGAAGSLSCDINNIKVYPITPKNGFWLDIDASTSTAIADIPDETTTTSFEICAPDVSLAEITTPGDISTAVVKYEYGVTTIYAIIHAAGYQGNFTGTLKISGLEDNQTSTVITSGVTWTAAGTNDTPGNGSYTATLASTTAGSDIPVTITITHNQHENITDQPIRISIDGTYTDGTNTFDDLSDENGICTAEDVDADYVIQTITPRPNVLQNNPANFVTPNPALRD